MAISVPSPYAFATDIVSIKEATALLGESGHKVEPKTLKRWAVKHGVKVEKAGRDDLASWTDLLEVHALEIDRREARGH